MEPNTEQEQAKEKLKRLKDELGTWRHVGYYVSNRVPGSPKSWMVITNAVARGTRKANHNLLIALKIRKHRRRFSCDIPGWMSDEEEELFRGMMRETAAYHAFAIRNGRR